MTPDDHISQLSARPARPVDAGIPPSRAAREQLLAAVRDYAREQKLIGPATADDLTAAAETVLAELSMPAAFREYAAVLLNNEIWRDTVAGIPYNRRVLLLPRCLHDTNACKADTDGVGLICRTCGACVIGDFQTEAQRLGYVVLVAEGSPVVMSLIQSGRIDAVVGVSCLETLESVYPYMEAGAVPGIAIPLLQGGCADTSLDTDWLWDAVYLSSDDHTRRLDLDKLRRTVEEWFDPQALDALLGPTTRHAEQLARGWLAQAGKRWRPFLAACAAAAVGDQSVTDDPTLQHLAVAIECFHKASLIHDDIEDGDQERYARRTLHAEHGVPVALNAGDLLVGEGYRLIGHCACDDGRIAAMLRIASSGHHDLCIGQGQELAWAQAQRELSAREVLDIFRLKTAPAFHVALGLGALFSGADSAVVDALGRYAESLGIAYQIRDDLSDDAADRTATAGPRPSIVEALRTGGQDTAARRRATALMEHHKSRAVAALRDINNANLKGLLRRVVAKIFNDVETMGCCDDHQP